MFIAIILKKPKVVTFLHQANIKNVINMYLFNVNMYLSKDVFIFAMFNFNIWYYNSSLRIKNVINGHLYSLL